MHEACKRKALTLAAMLLAASICLARPAAAAEYSVSGTVSVPEGVEGRIYLKVFRAAAGGVGEETSSGTSLESAGGFTIRGVAASGGGGAELVVGAFVDAADSGVPYLSSPQGVSAPFSLSGDVSGVTVAVAQPAGYAPGIIFDALAVPFVGRAFVFTEVPREHGSFGFSADSIEICWDDDDTFLAPVGCLNAPVEDEELNVVIDDLAPGNLYYFRATPSLDGSAGPPFLTAAFIPLAPDGNRTVSGAVTFTGVPPPTGTAVYITAVNESLPAYYLATAIVGAGQSVVPFAITGVAAGTYLIHAIADINGDSIFNTGDAQTSESAMPAVVVAGSNVSGVAVTLTDAGAHAAVTTQHWLENATESYWVAPSVEAHLKRPVRVALTAGPGGAIGPIDIGLSASGGFDLFRAAATRPQPGDPYTLNVTYADGSNATLAAAVTTVLDAFVSSQSPSGPLLNNVEPDFSWLAPVAPLPSFAVLNFSLWSEDPEYVPLYREEWLDPATQGLPFPLFAPLSFDTPYRWSVEIEDVPGNRAVRIASFVPVTSLPEEPAKIAVYDRGSWYVDSNGNHAWDGTGPGGDLLYIFGTATMIPVTGRWGGGVRKLGAFDNGVWYLDANGNGSWDGVAGGDRMHIFGTGAMTPVPGDWNGDGISELGAYENGVWYLDFNGNGLWDGVAGGDRMRTFGTAAMLPQTIDVNGDGVPELAVFENGVWYLDANGNGSWDGVAGGDRMERFGTGAMAPRTGDWNGDGFGELGAFENGTWYVDANGNGSWDGTGPGGDAIYLFGYAGCRPRVL